MNALINARSMGKEEVIQKIREAGLREYGVFNSLLANKWNEDVEANKEWNVPMKLVVALNNNDMDHAMLGLFETLQTEILGGVLISAYALEAETMEIYVPEGETETYNKLKQAAKEHEINVLEGMVNVRECRGASINHIATMAMVGQLFAGAYKKRTWISVCENDKHGNLLDLEYGTAIRDISGVRTENVKAVLIGSTLYDSTGLDLVIEEDTNIGNGVIRVFSNEDCIIDSQEKLLMKERESGCGRCTFCREGLIQLYVHTKDITEGKGKKEAVSMMEEIGKAMTFSCQCSVGLRGADFVLGSLKYFMNEYTEHISKKNCPANVCTSFTSIYIDPNLCEGCEACADACPKGCIEGKSGYIHMIDEFDCDKCGKCINACEHNAVLQTSGRVPKLPERLIKCGKFKKH